MREYATLRFEIKPFQGTGPSTRDIKTRALRLIQDYLTRTYTSHASRVGLVALRSEYSASRLNERYLSSYVSLANLRLRPSLPFREQIVSRMRTRLSALPKRWGWSNSLEAWRGRVGIVLLLLGILAGYWLFDTISLAALALLATLWAAALLVFLRTGWLRLLGPLFLFDLFRSTRRSRYFLLRIYVYFVLLMLFCVVISWGSSTRLTMRVNRGARTAEQVFYFFLFSHFAFSALFTPGYVASALTEEKERNTLEALMATDLSSREIVLSKLAVRLANLGTMLLTGLPILAMLQVMGGIDPDFTIVGYVAILFFTITLACLAISNSVRCRRTRDAIMATYIELGAYLALTAVVSSVVRFWRPPLFLDLGFISFDFGTVFDLICSGNPIVGLGRITEFVATGGQLSHVLGNVLGQFLAFHVVVSVLLTADAVRRFRSAFRKQTYGQLAKDSNRLWRLRPSIGNWPLLWKELYTDASARKSWFRRLLMGLLILASFLPIAVIELEHGTGRGSLILEWAYFNYVSTAGCFILCVLLIRVVVQAALVFSRERDQQTLDSLLTCPVSTPSIIASKWLGCMLGVRKLWLWLAAVWTVGFMEAGLPIMTVVSLVGFWIIYAGVSTLFGQWCSLVCKTSLRAIVFTLVALAITTSGVLVLPFQITDLYIETPTPPGFRTWVLRGQLGMAPPVVFGRIVPLHYSPNDKHRLSSWEWPTTLAGAGIWSGVGAVLWLLLCRRLRDEARRAKLPQPAEAAIPLQFSSVP